MAFNIKKFMNTKFQPRTAEIDVPDMQAFFEEGDKPVFIVRGLNGTEFTSVREAAEKRQNITGLLEGLLSTVAKDKYESLREALKLGDSVPVELVKRIEMLKIGSVEPKLDDTHCVRIAEIYPVEFYSITTKILELTGLGQSPLVEPRPSGKTPESRPHSPSATTKDDSSSR